ncbi:hypothetical protein OIO90_002888 [Microbotryomycetes sp. JL221]|nr:hypothetical protein OIO90_002888 [Microbotryomycetes sp. JL221]
MARPTSSRTSQALDSMTLDNLVNLVSDKALGTSNVVPANETVAQALQLRFKQPSTTTMLGSHVLVSINPFEVTTDVSDVAMEQAERKQFLIVNNDDDQGGDGHTPTSRQHVKPGPYEFAGRVVLKALRTKETQSVVYSGVSGSGSTTQHQLVTAQILRLTSSTKKDTRIAEQVKAFQTVLTSFGSAKTSLNPSSTRHSTLLELHLTNVGKLAGAKMLTWGLEHDRVTHMAKDERSFHVFYQLLKGATIEERQEYDLLPDMTDYQTLATSSCYQLPPSATNPISNLTDDAIAFSDLKNAFKMLGFKPRHVTAIWKLLSAILLLGNLDFDDHRGDIDFQATSAWCSNKDILDRVAILLGVNSEQLETVLTNKTTWVRREIVQVLLERDMASKQRDRLQQSLYSILFAFVIETSNHKVFPGDEVINQLQDDGGVSILQLDQPGFVSKSRLNALDRQGSRKGTIAAQGLLVKALNGFDEFMDNYSSEVTRFWTCELEFDGDSGKAARAQEDGVRVPDVVPQDSSARIELLRGGRVGGKADKKPGGMLGGMGKTCASVRKGTVPSEADGDHELLKGMKEHFGVHTSFMSTPGGPGAKSAFGVKHWLGPVTYDGNGFVESDLDALDPEFVALLQSSSDAFVAKLWSGPSLAAEVHPLDESIIVAAQVSSQPLRRMSPFKRVQTAPRGTDLLTPLLDPTEIHPVSAQLNSTLASVLNVFERTHVWHVLSLKPNDNHVPRQVDQQSFKQQIAGLLLPELIARNQIDLFYDEEIELFADRHGIAGGGKLDTIKDYLRGDLGVKDDQYRFGTRRIWLSYEAWRQVEDKLRQSEPRHHRSIALQRLAAGQPLFSAGSTPGQVELDLPPPPTPLMGGTMNSRMTDGNEYGFGGMADSVEDLLSKNERDQSQFYGGRGEFGQHPDYSGGHQASESMMNLPTMPYMQQRQSTMSDVWGQGDGADSEKGGGLYTNAFGTQTGFGAFATTPGAAAGAAGGAGQPPFRHNKEGVLDAEGRPQETQGATVEEVASSRGRRVWVAMVWGLTWWCPTWALTKIGRMKRPDVRMAWREKLALCMLIAFFCGLVIFYIVVFGRLLCPNMNKAWNTKEVGYHAGASDYWVSVRGEVYDLTKFYRKQHSDIIQMEVTSTDMLELAGQDLTNYFPIPLTYACPNLVTSDSLVLQYANFTDIVPTAIHTSGSRQPYSGSELHYEDWYGLNFLPTMRQYRKGPLVWSPKDVRKQAEQNSRLMSIIDNKIYDLSDYFYTIDLLNDDAYKFLDDSLASLFQAQPGADITSDVADLGLDQATFQTSMDCITTLFYVGETDFRLTPRCQVQPSLLLAFSLLLCATILAKFLAALQFSSKRMPEMRDKFVICQVTCYTEGEESLRKTIDSLATLTYDDKRKLLLIICDGMIIGSGNDKATPRIVLDILGVDQDNDPDPLMFKSVAEGSKQLNYGKVWSGLYEVEGHVVPYLVVAKVGRPSERSRPGNRGKRDSQILAMRFLNRVHFDSEMYPLELEMYHQVKNVIGVDPQLYEYLLVIDADTSVEHDSLNRLVSAATDDSKIIGICGETRLENENDSWWTMIQVYEYFISHHMAKAFESLFGSVTCLPGCFSMYRLRSADKGKPLLCSSLIIDDYSEGTLDTLHKKNLLSLGEDRYLTTLILKHFPNFKTKFIAHAHAQTVAPHSWKILLSQRRRWINSTVHNLAELMFLPDMCGFCCFSMRFFVLIDLVGTLILPATFVYLLYLIIEVATGNSSLPVIAIVMIAATYGLQAIIFILKRKWQFVGWLIIYILAYPIYSFVLPIYSFWRFDDFTWGNTRVVVGEGKSKKILQAEEEAFDESTIPMAKFAEYEARVREEDDDAKSYISGRTHSTTGFSLATRMPPGSYRGGPDHYRDTTHSRHQSQANLSTYGMSPYAIPAMNLPSSRPGSMFGGAVSALPSSRGGSEYAYPINAPRPGSMAFMPTLQSQMSFGAGAGGDALPSPPNLMGNRRASGLSAMSYGNLPGSASVFSMNAFAPPAPSQSTNPSDDELLAALKAYLASQDLMTVTKRTAREGLQTQCFPNADLSDKRDTINNMIDGVLQGRL